MVFRRQEPGQWKAGTLAVLVHLLFLGVLIFGVSWQNREPAAVEVELWSELPGVATKHVQPPPPPPKPAPELRPEPKPVKPVKPEPPPQAKPNKAEIELKAKEARRKEDEEKKRKLEELKREDKLKQEQHKQDELRKQDEKRKEELERKAQQERAEKLRQQQAQADAAKAQKAQAAAANSALQKLLGDYKSKIQAKIKGKIILPPDLAGNPQAEFDVTLMPSGEVLNLKLVRSSGSASYDSAVERAIYKAQPLPLPPAEQGLFSQFRELNLKFKLNED